MFKIGDLLELKNPLVTHSGSDIKASSLWRIKELGEPDENGNPRWQICDIKTGLLLEFDKEMIEENFAVIQQDAFDNINEDIIHELEKRKARLFDQINECQAEISDINEQLFEIRGDLGIQEPEYDGCNDPDCYCI